MEDIHEDNELLLEKPGGESKLIKKLEKYYLELLNDSHIWTVKE